MLHIIGLGIILSYFFRKYIYLNIVFSFIFVLLGSFLNTNLTIILFLVFNPNLLSIDYVPLLPWFGVILLGICIGNLFKKYFNKRIFVINLNNSSKFIKKNFLFLEYLGKNSLIIYLIHQPIILFGLL